MPTTSQRSTNDNNNLTSLLPALLQSHNLKCTLETPQSASALLSQNKLSPRDFIEQHPDIERTLLQSFLEDDYDGKLHLMTLSSKERGEEIIGLSFWREVDDEEMREWLDLHRVEETLQRHADDEIMQQQPIRHSQNPGQHQQQQQQKVVSVQCDGDNKLSHCGKRTMEGIRNDSITWIRNALHSDTTGNHKQTLQHTHIPKSNIQQQLIHAWVKIELIAIKRSHRSHHLGELLLACTLSEAYQYHDDHAILHIAGTSSRNIPATKLYTKFGFVGLPRYREGGPFAEPDGDLFVLGDIGGCLEKGAWEEMWKS
ncbi:hypothetical protein HJC23_006104 [Cyclotella cryptica]|uniref:N-acetyltransferase domain-containing protein n=1 Tax=Cyclotella cryptica TaxID=29204 RepID=A0ABD3QKC5_9STRA|eukprot:CCRYP_004571-RA/>CCRYP_004571-RA protein AED:0.04 eAED:0.04 QI:88/-1/1/1/-1/1/1/141/312